MKNRQEFKRLAIIVANELAKKHDISLSPHASLDLIAVAHDFAGWDDACVNIDQFEAIKSSAQQDDTKSTDEIIQEMLEDPFEKAKQQVRALVGKIKADSISIEKLKRLSRIVANELEKKHGLCLSPQASADLTAVAHGFHGWDDACVEIDKADAVIAAAEEKLIQSIIDTRDGREEPYSKNKQEALYALLETATAFCPLCCAIVDLKESFEFAPIINIIKDVEPTAFVAIQGIDLAVLIPNCGSRKASESITEILIAVQAYLSARYPEAPRQDEPLILFTIFEGAKSFENPDDAWRRISNAISERHWELRDRSGIHRVT